MSKEEEKEEKRPIKSSTNGGILSHLFRWGLALIGIGGGTATVKTSVDSYMFNSSINVPIDPNLRRKGLDDNNR